MNKDTISRRRMILGSVAALASADVMLRAQESDAPAANASSRAGSGDGSYTPVIVPNGSTLPFKMIDGVKVFHLIAEPVNDHEFAPGLNAHCWGYNGQVHGPVIEAIEGDRVRIFVTNRLPEATSLHCHGILLPSGMDGVGGLNQPAIKPGETYVYEFTLRQHGTFMYHAHHDEMTQMGLGMVGMFVIHPRQPSEPPPDRDFALMLHEWSIPAGTSRPNINEMNDFNVLTINAKVFPATAPLVVRMGQRVRIRLGNLGAMDHHPMHLHGYHFTVTHTDGGDIPLSARHPQATVLVPVGATRAIEFVADNPGDWVFHCHMTHHIMNQMGHQFPNMIGLDKAGLDQQVRAAVPGYMTMGQNGMAGMMKMPTPPNSISMGEAMGPFDPITMGGMFTILKVREELPKGFDADPGWYEAPTGTQATTATAEQIRANGIEL